MASKNTKQTQRSENIQILVEDSAQRRAMNAQSHRQALADKAAATLARHRACSKAQREERAQRKAKAAQKARNLRGSVLLRLEERTKKEQRIAIAQALGESGQKSGKRSYRLDTDVYEDLLAEAIRQGRSLSWLMQRAWVLAKEEVTSYPAPPRRAFE